MIVVSLRSMPSLATGAPPNPNVLLVAVYESQAGESNDAVEGHSARLARMSGPGYEQTSGCPKSTSDLPPTPDIPGGVGYTI
jgi:hypothetical protein